MNETTLDEIMKCSKEAITRAYMCNNNEMRCPVGKCPFVGLARPFARETGKKC